MHFLSFPIRTHNTEKYWYMASEFFNSDDPYCPVLNYNILQLDGSELTEQQYDNHHLSYNDDEVYLDFYAYSESFEDPLEGAPFMEFKITA
jgi:hypothetical protein